MERGRKARRWRLGPGTKNGGRHCCQPAYKNGGRHRGQPAHRDGGRHCCQPAHRNGGRHCCQPPLRRALDLPVFVTWIACAPPSFDPSSPAQASRLDDDPDPKTVFSVLVAALLGSTLFSRFPSLLRVRAAATERSTLPAPLADWSSELPICLHPEGLQRLICTTIACRRRSVHRFLVAPFPKWPRPLPRSPLIYAPRSESLKAETLAPVLWITGISRITSRGSRLPFRSCSPNPDRCPNPPP